MAGRLAPTPSGVLHLGNVCAFAAAWLSARSSGTELLLRIEDIDTARSRQEIVDSVRADLDWLGITYDREVPAQSKRSYREFFERLSPSLYPCACTRKEVRARGGHRERCTQESFSAAAYDTEMRTIRFDLPGEDVLFTDAIFGPQRVDLTTVDHPVVRQRSVPTKNEQDRVGDVAYNLAVVADDLVDGVTEVVRGSDLLSQTAVQIVLRRALGADTPLKWAHTPMILGEDGHKLSKRHGSTHVQNLRQMGWTVGNVWRTVLPWLGLSGEPELRDALPTFEFSNVQMTDRFFSTKNELVHER